MPGKLTARIVEDVDVLVGFGDVDSVFCFVEGAVDRWTHIGTNRPRRRRLPRGIDEDFTLPPSSIRHDEVIVLVDDHAVWIFEAAEPEIRAGTAPVCEFYDGRAGPAGAAGA